ncbi:antiviral reverse transcriptase Drt3b [Brevundimonas naejangsanensis]|uniref:antiviral reverse transcriptase Drt3b n=1 Tax=Brevundimonas naejangsanensis TaxID=588932 RepID=UPI00041CD9AE|nr:antiviral reverse transcriptase Drt3b [Brevundimonas naejangsanensis]
MSDQSKKSLRHRALLTETLPYELPVIFSNDRLHAGLSTTPTAAVQDVLDRVAVRRPAYTIPYNYGITKDRERTTTLSVVHPLLQREMADFYELHAMGMLAHCSRGDFSLRHPAALASPFTTEVSVENDQSRSGIPQMLAAEGEPDPSHMTSYFVYGKYNLLGKFVSSREYIRLEERHPVMRTIDVSKCFYNIYTHSITWAVKDKSFAKEHRSTYSFESAFDGLMQRANYNETNGIVVGPEISRVFAEIIFQDIDDCVRADMLERGLIHGRHYDVRRYVDDYFVFTGSIEHADLLEGRIRHHLERYKLYVNDRKVATSRRPFVSGLSIAREHVAATLREVSTAVTRMRAQDAAEERAAGRGGASNENAQQARAIRARLNHIRLIVAEHEIQFANLSGWLLSRLRRLISRCLNVMSETADQDVQDPYSSVVISALETALYVCAVDLRVRTTYSLCQLVQVVERSRDVMPPEQYDLAIHLISDSLSSLIRRQTPSDGAKVEDNVELFNLLICGAHFIGNDFLASTAFRDCLERLLDEPRLTYFAYITLMFCIRKQAGEFQVEIGMLKQRARDRVLAADVDIWRDTEEYLIAIDYLASPDVGPHDKRSLFRAVFGGEPRLATWAEFGSYAGFADWSGLSVDHQLQRKALRPVYAWT